MMRRTLNILALLGALFSMAASPARAAFENLYSAGHADIGVDYDAASGLSLYELSSTAVLNGSKIGGSGLEADPSDITVVVPESVLTTGDSRLPAPFANNPLYLLLQSSAGSATRPFLGFGAEEIDSGVFVNDTLTLSLTAFSSDSGGQFVLYQTGSWASPNMNTADGLSAADFIDLFAGGHDHFNLGFTTAGSYLLTFTATGTLVSGGTVQARDVFHFQVGDAAVVPEPTSMAMAGLGLGILALGVVRRSKFLSRA